MSRPAAAARAGLALALPLLALGAVLGLAWEYVAATDFPTGPPIGLVDDRLVAELRAHPGWHRPLAADHRITAQLELVDDATNRALFGTHIDLREPVARNAIHIQAKGDRLAIHADGYNPKAGLGNLLLHNVVDVPVIPLLLVLVLAGWGARRLRRARGAPSPATG